MMISPENASSDPLRDRVKRAESVEAPLSTIPGDDQSAGFLA
jgi:hypothetical protein